MTLEKPSFYGAAPQQSTSDWTPHRVELIEYLFRPPPWQSSAPASAIGLAEFPRRVGDGQEFLSSALLPFLLPLMTGCLTERMQVVASSQQTASIIVDNMATSISSSTPRDWLSGHLLGGKIRGHLVHEQFQDADGLGRAKGMETTRNDRDPKPPRNSCQPCVWQSSSGGNYPHRHLLERNDSSGESVNVGSEIGALHV